MEQDVSILGLDAYLQQSFLVNNPPIKPQMLYKTPKPNFIS
jgi:hypothetical protein